MGREGVLPGTQPGPIPGPIFNIFRLQGPTHGQMKAFSEVSVRFPRMGLEWVQNWPRIDLRMTPESTLQDMSQTGPEMTLQTLISRT